MNALPSEYTSEKGSANRLTETISSIGVPDPCFPRQVALIASSVPRHEGNAWGRRIPASLMDPFAALNAGSRFQSGMYIILAQARSSASRDSSICLLLRPTSSCSPGTERTEVPGIQRRSSSASLRSCCRPSCSQTCQPSKRRTERTRRFHSNTGQ